MKTAEIYMRDEILDAKPTDGIEERIRLHRKVDPTGIAAETGTSRKHSKFKALAKRKAQRVAKHHPQVIGKVAASTCPPSRRLWQAKRACSHLQLPGRTDGE